MKSESIRLVLCAVLSSLLTAALFFLLPQERVDSSPRLASAESFHPLETRLDRILDSLQAIDAELRKPRAIPVAEPTVLQERTLLSESLSPLGLNLQPLQSSVEELLQVLNGLAIVVRSHVSQLTVGKEYQAIHDKVASLGGKKNVEAVQSFWSWLRGEDAEAARRSVLFKSGSDILDMFGVPDRVEVSAPGPERAVCWVYDIPVSEGIKRFRISFDAGLVIGAF